MPISDLFDSIFGNHHGGYGRPPEFGADSNFGSENPNVPRRVSEDDVIRKMFDFQVMMDPFEMQRLFEQQINEMMKSFMANEGLPGFGGLFPEGPEAPEITGKQDLRDQYLKPGARVTPPSDEGGNTFRSGPITSWLDKYMPKVDQDGNSKEPQFFSSYRMISRTTVTLPDGTVKTEEVIRNSDGSEERTESHSRLDGSSIDAPAAPDFSDNLLKKFKTPALPKYEDPRYQYLKPGYEKFNTNSKKIDKDLDKHIEQEGVESLPPLIKESEILQQNISAAFKRFTRKTLPNGAIESEEVVRNPDGTEQRTITHTWPDGTSKHLTVQEPLPGYKQWGKIGGHDNHHEWLSVTLRGVKDFLNILFR